MFKDITILIKTFEREDALRRLLDSIRKKGLDCPILIADDSREPYKDAILDTYGDLVTEYVVLPFNSGVSKGRNVLLDRVQTKYFLLNDDDFAYEERTDLQWMREQLEANDLDLLSATVFERDDYAHPDAKWPRLKKAKRLLESFWKGPQEVVGRFQCVFEVEGDVIVRREIPYTPPITRCDYSYQFFLANTEAVREKVGGWDEDLKAFGEHWEFFYRAKKGGLRVAATEETGIRHYPARNQVYDSFRFDREEYYKNLSLSKHGFTSMRNEHLSVPA